MASIKKNFFYVSIYQVLIFILPLMMTPYVARVLGAECSGIFAYVNTIANYFVVLGMLGLEQYGNRCIAQVRDDKDKLNRVFSELFYLHASVAIIVFILYLFYCSFIVNDYINIFYIQGVYVVSIFFDINWFFFGIEKFMITVTRNAVVKIGTFLAVFICVKDRDDFVTYVWIMSLSIFISQMVVWSLLRNYVNFIKVPISAITKHFQPLLVLFVAVISANINRMIDKIMLGYMGMVISLGCYDYADKIIRMPLSFIASLGVVMLAKMSNLYAINDKDRVRNILDVSAFLIIVLSIGMTFCMVAVAPEFVIIFLGDEYIDTIQLVTILSFSIPIVAWNNYIRTQILIPKEMDAVYTKAVTVGAIANILTNIFMIPHLGGIGAAYATVFSYVIILVIQMLPLKVFFKSMIIYTIFPILSGCVMYVLVRIVATIIDDMLLSAIVEITTGILIYGGLSWIYIRWRRPDVANKLFKI